MAAPARTVLRCSVHQQCLTAAGVASSQSLSTYSSSKAQVQPVTTQLLPDHVDPVVLPRLTTQQRPPPQPHHLDRNSLSSTYFDATRVRWIPVGSGGVNEDPQDPNKAKLGKTLRILQERLPTLLLSPLPANILAPNITLHLFPTTHPHLPTVSGKVAYNAALWTSPIAWNRVPIVGNVRLEILAERMTSEPVTFLPRRPGAISEQLIVRWCEKTKDCKDKNQIYSSRANANSSGSEGGIARNGVDEGTKASPARSWLSRGVDPQRAFTGLFIFDFDSEGRILSHTIEQAQESGNWEKGMGAKFVGLTDWLLGGMKSPADDTPLPAFQRSKP